MISTQQNQKIFIQLLQPKQENHPQRTCIYSPWTKSEHTSANSFGTIRIHIHLLNRGAGIPLVAKYIRHTHVPQTKQKKNRNNFDNFIPARRFVSKTQQQKQNGSATSSPHFALLFPEIGCTAISSTQQSFSF